MKKFFAVFLAVVFLFSFAACSFGQKSNFADKTLEKFYLQGLPDFLGTDFKREKNGIDYLLAE